MEWCFWRLLEVALLCKLILNNQFHFSLGFAAFTLLSSLNQRLEHTNILQQEVRTCKCKYSTQNIIDKLAQNISKHSYTNKKKSSNEYSLKSELFNKSCLIKMTYICREQFQQAVQRRTARQGSASDRRSGPLLKTKQPNMSNDAQ